MTADYSFIEIASTEDVDIVVDDENGDKPIGMLIKGFIWDGDGNPLGFEDDDKPYRIQICVNNKLNFTEFIERLKSSVEKLNL